MGAVTGIGVAGIYQNGLGRALPQAFLRNQHRRGFYPIAGEDAGGGGGSIGHQQGQILNARFFDARGGGGEFESRE